MTATPAAAPAPAITDTAIPVMKAAAMNPAASAIARRPAMSADAAMKKKSAEPIPVMDYGQFRRAKKLVHECCNYDNGQCIANRAKYCPDCAARMKRKHAAERKRKQRRICHALGTEKAL